MRSRASRESRSGCASGIKKERARRKTLCWHEFASLNRKPPSQTMRSYFSRNVTLSTRKKAGRCSGMLIRRMFRLTVSTLPATRRAS